MVSDNNPNYFQHNSQYTYEPVLISGMYVHPNHIYDGFEKPFIAKVNLKYSYSFYNGYELEILEGDEVYIKFNSPSNHPKYYAWEYTIYVNRNGKRINHWSDKVRSITYNEQQDIISTFKDVENMIENFRLQLEGKIPSFDKIHENKKPTFDVNINDTFIGFTWDNGLTAIKITDIDNEFIYHDSQLMGHHSKYNTYYGERRIEKTTIDWLMKYYAKINFDFEKVLNNEILYNDIYDDALKIYQAQSKLMFENSLKELSK